MASSDRKAVSQFPYPPRRYIHNCATDRPMPPPPPPPTAGNYHMFGREYNLEQYTNNTIPQQSPPQQPLQQQPIQPQQQQQQHEMNIKELKRLNTLLLQLFVKLTEILCVTPTHATEQIEHEQIIHRIELTFSNMQQLINNLRPLQASIDLKKLLDKQTQNRKKITANLKDGCGKAWNFINLSTDQLIKPSIDLSNDCTNVPLQSLLQDKNVNNNSNNKNNNNNNADDDDGDDKINNLFILNEGEKDNNAINNKNSSNKIIVNDQLLSELSDIISDPTL